MTSKIKVDNINKFQMIQTSSKNVEQLLQSDQEQVIQLL